MAEASSESREKKVERLSVRKELDRDGAQGCLSNMNLTRSKANLHVRWAGFISPGSLFQKA